MCRQQYHWVDTNTWQETMKLSAYGKYLRRLTQRRALDGHVTCWEVAAEAYEGAVLKRTICSTALGAEKIPPILLERLLLGVPCGGGLMWGGVHNLLTDGVGRYVYPAGDGEALADRIMEVFTKRGHCGVGFPDNARKPCAGVNHDAEAELLSG